MAVGEAYASNEDAFSMAKDIAELGISVDWIYSDGKFKGKKEQISWLAENQKNAQVLLVVSSWKQGIDAKSATCRCCMGNE